MYREVILDHYKNPRGHGIIEDADASAEGVNPLCGDEVTISVAFEDDGDTIADVMFEGRGCAISQASTSMLMEMVKGRKASEVAEMPSDELLEEVAIPLTPVAASRVPRSALTFSSAGDLGLRIVDANSKVAFTPVSVVEDQQENMWVGGIADAARVIVQGQDFVREGQVVEPVAAQAPKTAAR